jgi:hypothetical protein
MVRFSASGIIRCKMLCLQTHLRRPAPIHQDQARRAEQTSKGIMWRDIGLDDWLFDFDEEADVKRLVPAVLALAKDPVAAKARALVERRQRETMAELKRNLPV